MDFYDFWTVPKFVSLRSGARISKHFTSRRSLCLTPSQDAFPSSFAYLYKLKGVKQRDCWQVRICDSRQGWYVLWGPRKRALRNYKRGGSWQECGTCRQRGRIGFILGGDARKELSLSSLTLRARNSSPGDCWRRPTRATVLQFYCADGTEYLLVCTMPRLNRVGESEDSS